jgi:hypothetical protein
MTIGMGKKKIVCLYVLPRFPYRNIFRGIGRRYFWCASYYCFFAFTFSQHPYKKHQSQRRPSLLLDVGKHRSSTNWKESTDSLRNESELDEKSREPTTTKMAEYIINSEGKTTRLVEDNSMEYSYYC